MKLDQDVTSADDEPLPCIGPLDQLGLASPFDGRPGLCIDLLVSAGLSTTIEGLHRVDGKGLEVVRAWLDNGAERHCLIFWRVPCVAIAYGMKEGIAPDQALAQWKTIAKQLSVLIRRNRHRITLAETTQAELKPGMLAMRLNQRFDLGLTRPEAPAAVPMDQGVIEVLIARSAVLADKQVRRLAAKLQEVSLPLAPNYHDLLPHPRDAWRQLEEMKSSQKARVSIANQDLQEENELLVQQLHEVQEELEFYYLECTKFHQKYERAEAERKKLERDRNAALKQCEVLQKRIDAMRASRSWRITKPLRAGNLLNRWKRH